MDDTTHSEQPQFTLPSSYPVWQVAAEIAGGMLANPARSAGSVKESLALFDQVVMELISYARAETNVFERGLDDTRHEQYARAMEPAEPPVPAPVTPVPVPLPHQVPPQQAPPPAGATPPQAAPPIPPAPPAPGQAPPPPQQ